MKGVSAIIATVLLLVITIAMAGSAYVFMTGFFRSKTAVQLEVVPESESCQTNDLAYIYLRNVGTDDLSRTDVTVLRDGTAQTLTTTDPGASPPALNYVYFSVATLSPGTLVQVKMNCPNNVCKFQYIPKVGTGTTVSIFCP